MSDARTTPPSFDEMVGLIKKLYFDYQEDVLKGTQDEREKSWKRYETLNHLYQDNPWIKCSDRLPGKAGIYKVKREHGEDEDQAEFIGSVFTNYQGYRVYEWKDEGTAAAGSDEDAVEFAEWIRETYQPDEFGYWIDYAGNQYTTADRYTVFKQQKEKP